METPAPAVRQDRAARPDRLLEEVVLAPARRRADVMRASSSTCPGRGRTGQRGRLVSCRRPAGRTTADGPVHRLRLRLGPIRSPTSSWSTAPSTSRIKIRLAATLASLTGSVRWRCRPDAAWRSSTRIALRSPERRRTQYRHRRTTCRAAKVDLLRPRQRLCPSRVHQRRRCRADRQQAARQPDHPVHSRPVDDWLSEVITGQLTDTNGAVAVTERPNAWTVRQLATGIALIFTDVEWTAFRLGAKDGEFTQPFALSSRAPPEPPRHWRPT